MKRVQARARIREFAIEPCQPSASNACVRIFERSEPSGCLEAHNLIDQIGKPPFVSGIFNPLAEHARREKTKAGIAGTQDVLQCGAGSQRQEPRADRAGTQNTDCDFGRTCQCGHKQTAWLEYYRGADQCGGVPCEHECVPLKLTIPDRSSRTGTDP